MPIADKLTNKITDKLPSVISPRAHAAIDYATAAAFFGMGLYYWKANKRAGIAGLLCGGAELITAAITDYPGGLVPSISFRMHGRIDTGLATLVGSMPSLLDFADEPEARFFEMQAIALAAVTGLTDFKGTGKSGQISELRKAAA